MSKVIVGGLNISEMEDKRKKLVRKLNEIIQKLGLKIEILPED